MLTNAPPSTWATIEAKPIDVPYNPIANRRSCGANSTRMIASTCGVSVAAIIACSTREAISIVGFIANPHSADASVNPPIPTRNTLLRPKMSPSRPPVISDTANPIPYPATTNCNCAGRAPDRRAWQAARC